MMRALQLCDVTVFAIARVGCAHEGAILFVSDCVDVRFVYDDARGCPGFI